MSDAEPKLKPILYAEDDDNDHFLMERTFSKLGIKNPLKSVLDGKEAIAYLSGGEPFKNREENPLPCLMIIDLSMPGKSGVEVLQWARAQPFLADLPIVVLTSSNQASDIHRAYLIGASGFFIKPGDPDELIRIVGAIHQYWIADNKSRTGFIDIAAYRPSNEQANK